MCVFCTATIFWIFYIFIIFYMSRASIRISTRQNRHVAQVDHYDVFKIAFSGLLLCGQWCSIHHFTVFSFDHFYHSIYLRLLIQQHERVIFREEVSYTKGFDGVILRRYTVVGMLPGILMGFLDFLICERCQGLRLDVCCCMACWVLA